MTKTTTVEEHAAKVYDQELNEPLGALFAFYGTLRQHQGNYNYMISKRKHKVIGTTILNGYKMFSLGGYPFVLPSVESDTIVVDLIELQDEYSIRSIHAMETGAGYRLDKVQVNGQEAGLYVYRDDSYENMGFTRVTSGDWVKYKTLLQYH